MSLKKKKIRGDFNAVCMARDLSRCRICKAAAGDPVDDDKAISLDADVVVLNVHHITPREAMPDGGYVASNGITLCEYCHMLAEEAVDSTDPLEVEEAAGHVPSKLYEAIGSSYERALADSESGK